VNQSVIDGLDQLWDAAEGASADLLARGEANGSKKRPVAAIAAATVKHSLARKRWLLKPSAAIFTAVVLFGVVIRFLLPGLTIVPSGNGSSAPLAQRPAFIGAHACAECHPAEFKRWSGSHHQLAMQPATATTVLADFNITNFTNGSIVSTFFKRAGKFMVRTDGPDGALHDYEIQFTFGVAPLQQYLIAMPGGRLQALGIAWDTRPRRLGGQRWFSLYPNKNIAASDPLHWSGIDQTWNYMCADCHSTNVRKNYNLQTRTYDTKYLEINVACEACHGPGSHHLAWAKRTTDWKKFNASKGLTIALDERRDAGWAIDAATGNPHRITPRILEREIEMCARCHSRRGQINEDYVHGQQVGDDYRVALLDDDLYFPDGQVKGEVYEYGSFLQSRMYREGVTCSDCHEPHSLKLRADGNKLCLQCHSTRYDSPLHHFHQPGTAGALCANCHMPTHTYMVIDARRDHSIRIPQPDLSIKLGTPNACNECHTDESAQWASEAIYRWYGHTPSGFQHFAETLQKGAEGGPGTRDALDQLVGNQDQPAIARASALSLLALLGPPPAGTAVAPGVKDVSPLVRRSAAHALSGTSTAESIENADSLLNDPVRNVRIETAEQLAKMPADAFPAGLRISFERATDEYIAAQELNADRPEAHMNLGLLFAREGQPDRAEAELKTALSLDPNFAPAAVNLADLYRGLGRDTEGEVVLRSALRRSPDDASLLHALGLLMVRKKQTAQAIEMLAAAARLDPGNARYAYVYAVALNDSGRATAAIDVLEASIKMHPYDRDSLLALVTFLEQAGDSAKALSYAQRLTNWTGSRQSRSAPHAEGASGAP
jgi:predicted CXXCH cytochrome family protein